MQSGLQVVIEQDEVDPEPRHEIDRESMSPVSSLAHSRWFGTEMVDFHQINSETPI